jgi:hypothetical protein
MLFSLFEKENEGNKKMTPKKQGRDGGSGHVQGVSVVDNQVWAKPMMKHQA